MFCRFRVLVDIIILITSYFTISNCLTNIHFSTRTNTLINNTTSVLNLIYAQYFSFFEENGKHIVTCFLSSNNHFAIRSSSFFSIKIFDSILNNLVWVSCVCVITSNLFCFIIKVRSLFS